MHSESLNVELNFAALAAMKEFEEAEVHLSTVVRCPDSTSLVLIKARQELSRCAIALSLKTVGAAVVAGRPWRAIVELSSKTRVCPIIIA